MSLRKSLAERVGLPDSTAMLITRLRLRVSYALAVAISTTEQRASYQNIMHMDIDPCRRECLNQSSKVRRIAWVLAFT